VSAEIEIRPAVAEDAPVLSRLALRAKASWGYPPAWVEAWRAELTLSAELLRANPSFVASVEGRVAGCCVLEARGDRASLEHLWIAPERQRHGIGRALVRRALEAARRAGCARVEVVSDPHAEPFYLRLGARSLSARPAPMPGAPERTLAVLEFELPPSDAVVSRLPLPPADADVRGLARLLVDAVDSGAAVSFLAPLTLERAEAWWRERLGAGDGRTTLLVARSGEEIVGCVQLQPNWAPNQPHHGEVTKLLVHRSRRSTGLGERLMRGIEDEARRAGLALLTLDAKVGGAAERLYRKLGWSVAGVIPRYALDPDGVTPHDAVFFYKALDGEVG